MGASNILGLIFEIAADPSKAGAALDAIRAKATATGQSVEQVNQQIAASAVAATTAVNATQAIISKTIAQSLKEAGASAEEARQAYEKLGYSGEKAALEIAAAFGQANAEVRAVGAAAQAGGAELESAGAKGARSFTETRLQAQLLSNELGLRMPRAVTTLISHSDALAGALQAAFPLLLIGFAAQEVVRLAAEIGKATDSAMGYTEAVKKQFEEDVKANEEALRHFSTVQEGEERLAETTRRLGETGRVTFEDNISQGAKNASWSLGLLAIALGPILVEYAALYEIYNKIAAAGDEQVKLNDRLRAQQGELVHVAETEAQHQLKMAEGQVKADAAGKKAGERYKAELQFLGQKEQLEIQIAKQEAAQEALKRGGAGGYAEDVARRTAEIQQQIEIERQQLQGEIAGLHTRTAAAHEYSDALAQQLQRVNEEVAAITSGELPARQKINLEYARGIDAAKKSIAAAEAEYRAKHITLAQLGAEEKEYTDLVLALAARRDAELKVEQGKENEKLEALKEQHQKLLAEMASFGEHMQEEQAKAAKSPEASAQLAQLAALALGFRLTDEQLKIFTEDYQKSSGTVKLTNQAYKEQNDLLKSSPAVLAALAKAYPGVSLAALAAIPGIKQLTQAFRDQQTAVSMDVVKSLNNLRQLEAYVPQLASKYQAAFVGMSQAQQQFTNAAVAGTAMVLTSLNQELLANQNIGQALDAFYKKSITSLAGYLAQKAEMKALEQVAEALSSWPDVPAMAAHFAAAAAWAALGAGVSIAGAAAAGNGGGSGSKGASSGAGGGAGGSSVATGPAVATTARVLAPGAAGAQQAAILAASAQPTTIHMDTLAAALNNNTAALANLNSSVAGPSSGGSAGGPAPSGSSIQPPTVQRTEIHLHYEGGTYYGGPTGIDEFAKASAAAMAKHMSDNSLNRDIKLVATHAINQPPVSRGRS